LLRGDQLFDAFAIAALRKAGFTAEVCERFLFFGNVRQDLFGIFDIIAISSKGIIGIQSTSRSNISARVNKIDASENKAKWLRSWRKNRSVGMGQAQASMALKGG
jgi:hypothetical protein